MKSTLGTNRRSPNASGCACWINSSLIPQCRILIAKLKAFKWRLQPLLGRVISVSYKWLGVWILTTFRSQIFALTSHVKPAAHWQGTCRCREDLANTWNFDFFTKFGVSTWPPPSTRPFRELLWMANGVYHIRCEGGQGGADNVTVLRSMNKNRTKFDVVIICNAIKNSKRRLIQKNLQRSAHQTGSRDSSISVSHFQIRFRLSHSGAP